MVDTLVNQVGGLSLGAQEANGEGVMRSAFQSLHCVCGMHASCGALPIRRVPVPVAQSASAASYRIWRGRRHGRT